MSHGPWPLGLRQLVAKDQVDRQAVFQYTAIVRQVRFVRDADLAVAVRLQLHTQRTRDDVVAGDPSAAEVEQVLAFNTSEGGVVTRLQPVIPVHFRETVNAAAEVTIDVIGPVPHSGLLVAVRRQPEPGGSQPVGIAADPLAGREVDVKFPITVSLQSVRAADGKLISDTGADDPATARIDQQIVFQSQRDVRPTVFQDAGQGALGVGKDVAVLGRDDRQSVGQRPAHLDCQHAEVAATQCIGQPVIDEDHPRFGQRPRILEEHGIGHRADEVIEAVIAGLDDSPQQAGLTAALTTDVGTRFGFYNGSWLLGDVVDIVRFDEQCVIRLERSDGQGGYNGSQK